MTRYFHGGAPGLRPGDIVTPPTDDTHHLVDGCPTCEARRNGQPLADDHARRDRIYLTTERDYARIYAAGYPRGTLYTVEPLGELEETTGIDDPIVSWACPSARVLAVYDRLVIATPKDVRRWMRRYR